MLGVDSGLDEEAKEFLLVNVIISLWRTSTFSIFGSFGAHIIHSFILSWFGANISRRFYDCPTNRDEPIFLRDFVSSITRLLCVCIIIAVLQRILRTVALDE